MVHKDDIPSELDTKVLVFDHMILHSWWNKILKGETIEGWTKNEIKVLHDKIAKELIKRGLKHNTPLIDKESNEEPGKKESAKITLKEFLQSCKPKLDVRGEPVVFVVGSIVNKGWSDEGHDIDILIKYPYPNQKIIDTIKESFPPHIANKLEFIWDASPDAPLIGNAVPLYDAYFNEINNEQLFDLSTDYQELGGVNTIAYIGSKMRFINFITRHIPEGVKSILDGFAGSNIVSIACKKLGYKVYTNDWMKYSYIIAKAVIENQRSRLKDSDFDILFQENKNCPTPFKDRWSYDYFTPNQVYWIDQIYHNISKLKGYKRYLAKASLLKAMSMIRVRSDFDRKVKEAHDNRDFKKVLLRAYKILERFMVDGQECRAYNESIFDLLPNMQVDCAYFDPPYAGLVPETAYQSKYFVFEIIANNYKEDGKTKITKRHDDKGALWTAKRAGEAFSLLFEKAKHIPVIMISWSEKAQLSSRKIRSIAKTYGYECRVKKIYRDYTFDMGPRGRNSTNELLFICIKEKSNFAFEYSKNTVELKALQPFDKFGPLKAAKGYHEAEFFNWDSFKENWAEKKINEEKKQVAVEKKFDGIRFIIHRKGDIVKIVTEDRKRDRAYMFKKSVEDFLKLKPVNFILDAEMVEYTDPTHKKALRREDMIKWVVAKGGLDDSNVQFNVFDCLYYNDKALNDLPWSERQEYLKKVIPKDTTHIHRVIPIIAKTLPELKKAIETQRKKPNSEGAMVKTTDHIYPITGLKESRTDEWAKIKNVKQIKVKVIKIEKAVRKSGKEKGKPIEGANIYHCAIKDSKTGEDVFIGKTFATSIKAKVGDIIEVSPVKINIEEEDGKLKFSWEFPRVTAAEPTRTEPDTTNDAINIAEKGIAPLIESLIETLMKKELEICPYWKDIFECPLNLRFEQPMIEINGLKYPIKCKHAYNYRCVYVKDYYYNSITDMTETYVESELVQLEHEDLNENMIEQILRYQETVNLDQEAPTREPLLPKLLERPKTKNAPYVVQTHRRGDSVHLDWRFAITDSNGKIRHLVGWTGFDPKSVDLPLKTSNKPGMNNLRVRTVPKSRQPASWLKVEGKVEPGEVGATKTLPGFFKIIDKGTWMPLTQKPFFWEVWLNGDKFSGRWVWRAVKVPVIDPKTKKPIKGKTQIIWTYWKPKDQNPYIASTRAKREGFVPPKGVVPLPDEWVEKNPEKALEIAKYLLERWLK